MQEDEPELQPVAEILAAFAGRAAHPFRCAAPEFSVDIPLVVFLLRAMAQSDTKLTSPASLAVDAVLVIGFFLFIYTIVSPHVPSNDRSMVLLWGGLCAACMSGVFWLCVQMFRVVLRAQLADRRK